MEVKGKKRMDEIWKGKKDGDDKGKNRGKKLGMELKGKKRMGGIQKEKMDKGRW